MIWNCCNSNLNTFRRSGCCQCGSLTTTNLTTQNTNGWVGNGVFGYFIPVNYYNGGTNGCGCRQNCCHHDRSTRVCCGNGTYVTVTCGRQSGCGCLQNTQNTQTTQTNDNACVNTASSVGDCYYARQYGLCGNTYNGCGF